VIVAHRAGDFMYPIMVDPDFSEKYDWVGGQWPGNPTFSGVGPWQGQSYGPFYMFPGDAMSVGGAGLYILGGAVPFTDGQWAEWYLDPWHAHITIPRAEFQTSQRSQYTCTYTGIWTNPGQYRHTDCTWYDGYWDTRCLPEACSSSWDNIPDETKDFGRATFGYYELGSGTPCCTHWTVLRRSAIYYWDYYAPTVDVPDLGSRDWARADTIDLSGSVNDRGIGLADEHVTSPGADPGSSTPYDWTALDGYGVPCFGTRADPCPESHAFPGGRLTLDTTASGGFGRTSGGGYREGRIPIDVSTSERIGRSSTKRVAEFKIDRTSPAQAVTGTLHQPDGSWIGPGDYTLRNTPSDPLSGVQSDQFTIGPGAAASDRVDYNADGTATPCTAHTGCPTNPAAHDWTWTAPTGQDGPHQVSVITADPAGNSANQSWSVSLDTTDPAASNYAGSLAPHGTTIGLGQQSLSVDASDGGSGVKSVDLLIDGTPYRHVDGNCSDRQCGSSLHAELPWDSSDSSGRITITVRVTDLVGNHHDDSWDVIVDAAPPKIELSGTLYDHREEGVPDGSYQVHAHATDGDASARSSEGSGVTHIELRLDGDVQTSADRSCDAGNCPLDLDWIVDTATLQEREYTVEVRARDRFGRERTESFAFTVSRTPVNSLAPTIAGQPVDGQTLMSTPGSWSGAASISYTYQWQHCDSTGQQCADLVGETEPTIAVRSEDVGSVVRLQVTAHNGGASATAYSAATPLIAPVPPSTIDPPQVVGEPTVGQTLTAENGIWNGSIPITYTYQWLRCDPLVPQAVLCESIPGATSSDYDVTAADDGQIMRVRVTATNQAGAVLAATSDSEPTDPIGSFQADPSEFAPAEPAPPTAADDLQYAVDFRNEMGLDADLNHIHALDADPTLQYSRDHYGLSLSRYEQRDWELRESLSSVMRIVGDYGATIPDVYAGYYISDDGAGSIVHVGFTSDAATRLDELRGLFPYPSRLRAYNVAYSLQQLEAIQEQVSADYESGDLAAAGIEWAGDGVNTESNRLEIEVSNPSPTVEGALADRYGPAVTMIAAEPDEQAGPNRTKPQSPRGGLLIYPHPPRDPQHPERDHCTLGFVGEQPSTQSQQRVQAIVTAGHCSESYTYYPDPDHPQAAIKNREEWHQGRRTIGTTSAELTINSALPGKNRTFDKTPSSDAVSMGLPTRFNPKPYVYITSNTRIKVTDVQQTNADDGRHVKVCISLGQSNATRCGRVTAHRNRPATGGYPRVLDARMTSIRGVPGDSGSPCFLDTRKGTKDETMAFGVLFQRARTSNKVIYASAQHIRSDIFFRILTG